MGLEAQNEAAELKIRAQRKVGELLADMEISKGRPEKNVTQCDIFSLKDFAEEPPNQPERPQPVVTAPPRSLYLCSGGDGMRGPLASPRSDKG